MNAVPFDTLKMAQRLEAAGFTGQQAAGAAEALAEALVGADLATKADVESLRSDMLAGHQAIRAEMLSGDQALRAEMKSDNDLLRSDMKSDNASVRSEIVLLRRDMEVLRRDMTIRLGSMIVVGFGVFAAIMRLLPPHW